MKRFFIFITAILTGFVLSAQVEEKSSGTYYYSIKKDKKEVNPSSSGALKFSIKTVKIDENSDNESSGKTRYNINTKDETAPIITILSPNLGTGIKPVLPDKMITITGKVEDESGIFEVLINETEAKVSVEGIFQATVFLAYGDNEIKVYATDIKQNKSSKVFVIERQTEDIDNIENITVINSDLEPNISDEKKTNKILWLSPSQNNLVVSKELFNLKACIESSSEIISIKITNNNWTVVEKNLSNTDFISECDLDINEEIKLKFGENAIKIQITSDEKVFASEVIVKYDAISASYYALIIGVEEYDDPNINPLSEPLKDAKKLYNVLSDHYTFEKENITLLENPTKGDIIGKLHELRYKIKEEDNLLIFYAGHGYWDEEMGNGYWLPKDAAHDNPVNWLPNTDLTNYLNVLKSKHILLVADACFSGGIFRTRNAFNNVAAIEKLYQLKSRKAITSGTLKEVPDKSIFLKYFTQRLVENKEKYLTTEQLFSSLRMAVMNNSPNIPQYGTIQNVGDEGGDFIFIKKGE